MTVFNTIQGTSNTSFRVGLTGPTIYTGSADPTVTPPTPLADGFRDGDIYFRATTGGSAIWVIDNGGTWTQIASGAAGGTFSGDIVMNPGAQFLGDDAAGAGAPAYAFDGDIDTGMFNPNPNEIGFSVGGAQAFVIESDGTLASTTAGYELLVLADNDIPNRKYVEDTFINAAGDTFTGDLSMGSGTQIFLATGTALDPSLGFTGDTDSGFYLDGVGVVGVTIGGAEIANYNTDGIQMVNGAQFVGDTSSAATPAYSFNGDLDTGIFHDGSAGETAISSNGTETIRFSGTTANGTLLWQGGDGTVSTPALSFSSDPNSGMYRAGADDVRITTGGTDAFSLSNTAALIGSGRVLQLQDGTAPSPALQFASDPDTGVFWNGANTMAFSAGGGEIARITTDGILTIDGSELLPAYSFTSENDMGMYRAGANILGFAVDGDARMILTTTDARFDQQVRVEEGNQGPVGPAFSWAGDPDSGLFRASANVIGLSTGGVGRWTVDASGHFVPVANNTYDIGTSSFRAATVYATTFDGTATAAQYSDLAERYSVGNCCEASPGAVVVICDHDDHDICLACDEADDRVLGVVSTAPAFMMNKDAGTDEDAPYIALRGRVPVNVCGEVKKGDLLITCGNDGCARALESWEKVDTNPHAVFAKALASWSPADEDEIGQVEAVIL